MTPHGTPESDYSQSVQHTLRYKPMIEKTDAAVERAKEVHEIQKAFVEENRSNKRWIIMEKGSGFEVHYHDSESVYPSSIYPTKRLAAARLLQLLGCGPVAPQTTPETAMIGNLFLEPAGDDSQ